MIVSKGFIHEPGSEKAKALGCMCKILPNENPELPPNYIIHNNCPLHWHLDLIKMTQQIDHVEQFCKSTANVHTSLLAGLIALFIFVVGLCLKAGI